MALPRKLKNLNLFNDGFSYIGQVAEATLPPLTRQMEDWRGGGMNAPIKVDMGMQGLNFEWKCGGLMSQVLRQFGLSTFDGVQLRFAGAYQRDDSGAVDAVEIILHGRHEEIGMGGAKPGDDTSFEVKTACAYYKLTINGRVEIEVDVINMVEIVDGVDRLAAQRRAIGL